MFEQGNKDNQSQQQNAAGNVAVEGITEQGKENQVTSFNSPVVNGYLDRLKGTKKWWSKKNSVGYNSILDLLGLIRIAENNMEKVKYGVLIDLYQSLYVACGTYLDSHKSHRWTSVGRERFRLISEIKNMAQEKMVPTLTTNGTQEELENIEARNKQWRDSNNPVHDNGGLADIILKNTKNGNESAYKRQDGLIYKGMYYLPVHLGRKYTIKDLSIPEIMGNNTAKGFHDDSVDEQTNYNNMKQMHDDLFAGQENWTKKDVTPEQDQEIVRRNVRGLKTYKSMILRQQKHLYNKYGKFLTQLHPYDIFLKTNDLQNDAQLNDDICKIFGVFFMDETFDDLKNNFNKRKESNENLEKIFTPETEKEDLFIITSYWYYGHLLNSLNRICSTSSTIDLRQSISENSMYREYMIARKDIEKEKEVEKAAQAVGLGKMKEFTPEQKKVYLQTLKDRGMDKDFQVEENLNYHDDQQRRAIMMNDLNRLKGTKKWWSRKNSVEYNSILDLLGIIKIAESGDNNVKYGTLIDLYRNLYIACNVYLDSHKSYRGTSVGRERFRIILEIKNMAQEKLVPFLTTNRTQEELQNMMVPFLTTNGTQEELQNMKARNQQWRESYTLVQGFGGLASRIGYNRYTTESAYKKHEFMLYKMCNSIHLGKTVEIKDVFISEILQDNTAKGFHDDNVDEKTNYKNMIQMRDDLFAGHEDWEESDQKSFAVDDLFTKRKEENIMRNVSGLKAYRSMILRQQKHLYNKYGKFLTQLHPYDIFLRTNDLESDAQMDEAISRIFGVHDMSGELGLGEFKQKFDNKVNSNPILKLVFTPETRKEDEFILTSYWYYGFMSFKLHYTRDLLSLDTHYKLDFGETGIYANAMITQKDIEKEKEVEKAAQAIGLGKMKGFTPFEKKSYLQTLRARKMDKDFKVEENLTYQEE